MREILIAFVLTFLSTKKVVTIGSGITISSITVPSTIGIVYFSHMQSAPNTYTSSIGSNTAQIVSSSNSIYAQISPCSSSSTSSSSSCSCTGIYPPLNTYSCKWGKWREASMSIPILNSVSNVQDQIEVQSLVIPSASYTILVQFSNLLFNKISSPFLSPLIKVDSSATLNGSLILNFTETIYTSSCAFSSIPQEVNVTLLLFTFANSTGSFKCSVIQNQCQKISAGFVQGTTSLSLFLNIKNNHLCNSPLLPISKRLQDFQQHQTQQTQLIAILIFSSLGAVLLLFSIFAIICRLSRKGSLEARNRQDVARLTSPLLPQNKDAK